MSAVSIPAFSIFSAASELLVTAAVFYVFWRAYYRNDFRGVLLAAVLAFELAVNITYMVYRVIVPSHAHLEGWVLYFQAGHGILSLVMFLALIGFAVAARMADKAGGNLFREKPRATLLFVVLWTVSVASGEALFVMHYLV